MILIIVWNYYSYLSDKLQSVNCNDKFSYIKEVKHDVPQKYILGSVLFIIYINDLPVNISYECTNTYLFADGVN